MNSLTQTAPRSGSVSFPTPIYGQPVPIQIPAQKRGFDSNKKIYTTRKRQEAIFQHPLAWDTLPLAIRDQLLAATLTAVGSKFDCIWSDHLNVEHTVRIISGVESTQNGPDSCHCAITLEERIWCVYGGADGSVLMGADGTILAW